VKRATPVAADASYIETGAASTSFVGPDATSLFAAVSLRAAIRMWVNTNGTLKASRHYTPTAMAAAATRVTGKPYTRNRESLRQAMADLTTWIEAMKAALPVVRS